MFVPSVEAVRITIELLNQFKHEESIQDVLKPDYKTVTPEDFLEKHFAENNYSKELQDMVTEFFFRISKHRKYLEIIANKFVASKPSWATTNPQELFVYIVFLYLLVIELNEFTRSKIEDILISISDQKALSLLSFFKRKDTLTKLYDWGCQIWDVEYVTNLLHDAMKTPLFEEVYKAVTDHLKKIKRSKIKELTIPIGPTFLNRSKKVNPRSEKLTCQPPVSRIPVFIRASGTPSSTYVAPSEIRKLEKAHAKHLEQAQNLYEEAQKMAFRCANAEKSERFKDLTKKLEEEKFQNYVKKIFHKKVKPKTLPSPKKTAAVILRDGARLLKLENEEIKRYEDLASGGFNSDLIAEYEDEIRKENFRKRLEDIEKKHLEGLLSYEEALLAKRKCLAKNKEKADEFKKEKEIWAKQLDCWRVEEQKRLQEAVEREKALEKGVKEAVEQVKEEKHKIVLEAMEESKALNKKRMKEREEDLQKKIQMIKEIKALQALGGIKRKQVNFSETANLGFLCEMSIVELRERLFILRIEVQEDLERMRAEIKMKRESRKEILNSYQELIESHRQITKFRKEQRNLSDHKMNGKEISSRRSQSSSGLNDLRKKLYEKRKQRFQQL